MKKIKQYILRLRSAISIKTYKRPMLFVLSLILLFNIIVLSISSWIAMTIDDEYTNFFDAFTRGSIKWLLTPDSLAGIENSGTMVLAVFVLIVGMILFTGAIIGLTTNLIKDYLQDRKKGSGKIFLSNHIVILNWNNKVPELVSDLLNIEEEDIVVVILAEIQKSIAEKQIINAINKQQKDPKLISNINILVKDGSPLIQTDLSNISIEEARTIIVMNKDIADKSNDVLSKNDLNIIKTILSIGKINYTNNPPIVAEVKSIQTKHKIQTMNTHVHTLEDKTIIPICFDRRLGQVISQTILHTSMEDVYLSLFSFEGSEVYLLENTTFEQCLNVHSECLPVARKGDHLFVISKDDKTKHIKDKTIIQKRKLKTKAYQEATNLEVYIIGENNKLDFMLHSFNEYKKIYGTTFKSKAIKDTSISSFIDEINEIENPVTIVLLSDESKDDDSLDSNVINNIIYLEGNLKNKANIVVELLDPNNYDIIRDFNINNTIISNKILSLLLSKVALYPKTESFYENLLTLEINEEEEDDQELFIRKASDLFDEQFPITFDTKKSLIVSVYESFDKRVIPIGYIRDNKLTIYSEKLHQKQICTIQKTDSIVLMKLGQEHNS